MIEPLTTLESLIAASSIVFAMYIILREIMF